MDIDNMNLDELKKIDANSLTDKERKLLKKRKKLLKKQKRREEEINVIEKDNKRKKTKLMVYLFIFAISIFGGYFIYSASTSSNNVQGEVIESFKLTGETKEFTMVAKQWSFDPNTITVNKGDKVILNIDSVDVAHGIALPQFNIDKELVPGRSVTVEFIADKKGKFPFICSIYCGVGHSGMSGKVVVK